MRSFFVTVIAFFVLNAAAIPALDGRVVETSPSPVNSPNSVGPSSPGSPVSGAGAQGTLTAPHLLTCRINRRKTLFQWSRMAPAVLKSKFSTLKICFEKVEMYRVKFMTPNCGSAPWAVQDPDGVCRKHCWDQCIQKGADGFPANGGVQTLNPPWKGVGCHMFYGQKGPTGAYKSCYIGYSMASLSKTDPNEKNIWWNKMGQPTNKPPLG